jgi:hypothetical protein
VGPSNKRTTRRLEFPVQTAEPRLAEGRREAVSAWFTPGARRLARIEQLIDAQKLDRKSRRRAPAAVVVDDVPIAPCRGAEGRGDREAQPECSARSTGALSRGLRLFHENAGGPVSTVEKVKRELV